MYSTVLYDMIRTAAAAAAAIKTRNDMYTTIQEYSVQTSQFKTTWKNGQPQCSIDVNVHNLDVRLGPFLVRADALDLVHDVEALDGAAKDGVFPLEPRLVAS